MTLQMPPGKGVPSREVGRAEQGSQEGIKLWQQPCGYPQPASAARPLLPPTSKQEPEGEGLGTTTLLHSDLEVWLAPPKLEWHRREALILGYPKREGYLLGGDPE